MPGGVYRQPPYPQQLVKNVAAVLAVTTGALAATPATGSFAAQTATLVPGAVSLFGAPFVTDSFTDTAGTALQSHTGELGATWTKVGSTNDLKISSAGRLYHGNIDGGSYSYSASGLPPSPDYSVSGTLVVVDTTAEANGVCARVDPASSSLTAYRAQYSRFTGGWELFKFVTGSATQLGSTSLETLNIGDKRRHTLSVQGTTISLYVEGALKIQVTDAAITAAGRAGVRFNGTGDDTVGTHLDDLNATPNAAAVSTGAFTAQPATLSQATQVAATANTAAFSAPAASLTPGAVSLAQTANTAAFNAPAASLSQILAATVSTAAFSAQTATLTPGAASITGVVNTATFAAQTAALMTAGQVPAGVPTAAFAALTANPSAGPASVAATVSTASFAAQTATLASGLVAAASTAAFSARTAALTQTVVLAPPVATAAFSAPTAALTPGAAPVGATPSSAAFQATAAQISSTNQIGATPASAAFLARAAALQAVVSVSGNVNAGTFTARTAQITGSAVQVAAAVSTPAFAAQPAMLLSGTGLGQNTRGTLLTRAKPRGKLVYR